MSWIDKPWGATRPLYCGQQMHADEIDVKPGGFCSIHNHVAKANVFHVTAGGLYVRQFTAAGERLFCKYLFPGETTVVRAGVWHQFWALNGAKAVEVYLATAGECSPCDIERLAGLAVGGIESSYDEMCHKWRQAFAQGAVDLCSTK